MKILNYISILTLFVVFISFQNNESKTLDFLYQKWVYKDYQNGNLIYESKQKFKKDKAGIEFKENGTLIRKQNSGWCGTPPIDYEIVTGTWKNISDSLLEIEYKNWSGLNKDTLKIIELSKSKLTLKSIYTLKKKEISSEKQKWESNIVKNDSIPQGKMIYELYFVEFDGRMKNLTVEIVISGNNITVFNNEKNPLTGGKIIIEGILLKHKSGKWIIGKTESDRNVIEIGGCSDRSVPINFETKIIEWC